jgi:transcriptional regulator with XRE-family HTH domain
MVALVNRIGVDSPIMGTESRVQKRFRERVYAERTRPGRNWSQAELAKRLKAKGLRHILASTVAKIEIGERAVRIDEASALADLFAMSVDELLGRSAAGADLVWTASRLTNMASQNAGDMGNLAELIGDELKDIRYYAEFDLQHPDVTELITAAETAMSAAENAKRALAALAGVPHPGVTITKGSREK